MGEFLKKSALLKNNDLDFENQNNVFFSVLNEESISVSNIYLRSSPTHTTK